MKVETTVQIGYYKNVPRESQIISRVCGNDVMPHFSNECHRYTSAGGKSVRCYCDTDLCNVGPHTKASFNMVFLDFRHSFDI